MGPEASAALFYKMSDRLWTRSFLQSDYPLFIYSVGFGGFRRISFCAEDARGKTLFSGCELRVFCGYISRPARPAILASLASQAGGAGRAGRAGRASRAGQAGPVSPFFNFMFLSENV